jgi:hypothetical protein
MNRNVQSVSETGCLRSSFTQPHMACQGSILLQNAFHDAIHVGLEVQIVNYLEKLPPIFSSLPSSTSI